MSASKRDLYKQYDKPSKQTGLWRHKIKAVVLVHATATVIVKGNITYNNINQGEYKINLGCGIEAVYNHYNYLGNIL